jgi:hypothetical protein
MKTSAAFADPIVLSVTMPRRPGRRTGKNAYSSKPHSRSTALRHAAPQECLEGKQAVEMEEGET